MAIIPAATADSVDAEPRTVNSVEFIPVVGGQRVHINAPKRRAYRMKDEEIRRETVPHKLSDNGAPFVDLVSGTGFEVPAGASVLAGRIQGRRYTAAHIEREGAILSAQRDGGNCRQEGQY